MGFHFPNLVLYSVAVAALFAIFMREGTRERVRFAVSLSLTMVAIAVAASWLMALVG